MDRFCRSDFWDEELTWNTENPDFTDCFKKTVLIYAPCALFWIFFPIGIYGLRNRKKRIGSYTWLSITKLILTLALILLSIVDLGVTIYDTEYETVYYVEYCTPSIRIISFSFAAALLSSNVRYGKHSSGILFLFWLLLTICGTAQFRSCLQDIYKLTELRYAIVSYLIYYPLIVVIFLLNFFSDAKSGSHKHCQTAHSSPRPYASVPSEICFTWFDTCAWNGSIRTLEQNDLRFVDPEDTSNDMVVDFDKHWNKNVRNPQKLSTASVLPALWKAFGAKILFGGFLKLSEPLLILLIPQILRWFIRFVSEKEFLWKGYLCATLFLLTKTIGTVLMSQHTKCMSSVGLNMRTALIAAIYRKSLRLADSARIKITTCEIINLTSVNVGTLMRLSLVLHTLWAAPLHIICTCFILWNILGPAAVAGFMLFGVTLAAHLALMKKLSSLRGLQIRGKDTRLKLMNEILSRIKFLKLHAWEPIFERKLLDLRKAEINLLRRYEFIAILIDLIVSCFPSLICLSTFVTYVLSNEINILDADKVFVTLTLINLVQPPVISFSESIVCGVQGFVALKRINEFMNAEEPNPEDSGQDQLELYPVIIENGTFKWSYDETSQPVLRNIDIQVPRGRLVAVVGSIGSGKSSVLLALLGEMHRLSGRMATKGTIAYVSQEAWIQNGTVRSNILFGKPFDEKLYKRVLEACSVLPDLKTLPASDYTKIGENGTKLTDGQRQRISLARAVYNDADIYLLDDPLNAMDSHTSQQIFAKVIGPSGTLKNKTRLWVTRSIEYLSQVFHIFVLSDGVITEHGTYNELLHRRSPFAETLLYHLEELFHQSTKETLEPDENEHPFESATDEVKSIRETTKAELDIDQESVLTRKLSNGDNEIKDKEIKRGTWKVYLHYFRAVGYFTFLLAVFAKIICEGFNIGANVWLTLWIRDNETIVVGIVDRTRRDSYLHVYGALIFGQVFAILVAGFAVALGSVRSTMILHGKFLSAVFRAPMNFFDVTSPGRISSSLEKDLDILNTILPPAMKSSVFSIVLLLGTIVAICCSIPMFAAIILVVGVVYYSLQYLYVSATRQLQRLESESRYTVHCHFNETVPGARTIRAYGVEEKFIRELESKVHNNQSCWYHLMAADQWLQVRLEMLGNMVVFSVALFVVLQRDSIDTGFVGLAVSYALQITTVLQRVVAATSEVNKNIAAVERMISQSEIQPEAPWKIPERDTDEKWPCEGRIEFRDYKARYREGLNLILDGVSFIVHGGEKVGIVGRTGAGKSSLTLAIFRIIEAAGGQILIDDVDIATIGLQKLRSKLTIIPQDPMLFSGNLRMNLDPFDAHDDEEIWQALDHAHMKSFVQGLNGGLTYEITEGGSNFSVGQRQLICLTRALLRKTKILVLDEATASVDMETDEFIQRTIREEFKDCTVLTITHRLNTILDSDKIIVLDKGCVIEHDLPEVLLRKKTSVFYSIANEANVLL